MRRFLWARLQIDAICLEKTDASIRRALKDLPDGLPDIFLRILNRCKALAPSQQDRVLKLLSASIRILLLNEFHDAMGVEPGDISLSPSNSINNLQDLLGCCGSLVYADEEHSTLHFIHHSVKQFLLGGVLDHNRPSMESHSRVVASNTKQTSRYQFTLQEANFEMGAIIVTYLNHDGLNTQVSTKTLPTFSTKQAPARILGFSLRNSRIARIVAEELLKGRKSDVDIHVGGVLAAERGLNKESPVRQFHFRCYAHDYWLHHTKTMTETHTKLWTLFKKLVCRSDVVRGTRLWKDTYLSYREAEGMGFICAIVNSHTAFLRAEMELTTDCTRLLKHSIKHLSSLEPGLSISRDLYIELLQFTVGRQPPTYDTKSMASKDENITSLAIDSAAIAAWKKALLHTSNSFSYKIEGCLRLIETRSRSPLMLTCCVQLISDLPIDPPIFKFELYDELFQKIVGVLRELRFSTSSHPFMKDLMSGVHLTEDLRFFLEKARSLVSPIDIAAGHSEPMVNDTRGCLIGVDLCNILVENLIPGHDIHWDILKDLISMCATSQCRPWLFARNCSNLCELILTSHSKCVDLLPFIMDMTYSPHVIVYQRLLSAATRIRNLNERAIAVSAVLFYRKLVANRESVTYCNSLVSDPQHWVIPVGDSYLCECHVPETYTRALMPLWIRADAVGLTNAQLGS